MLFGCRSPLPQAKFRPRERAPAKTTPKKSNYKSDGFVKSLFFHHREHGEFFSLRLVISVCSVCSVVNFKFLRDHQICSENQQNKSVINFHTIIIGAGPGGLACARKLARNNIDVLVLERKSRIGPKTCAGGITWSGLVQRFPADLIEKSFRRQHIRSAWQQTDLDFQEPIIATVNRETLGQWMLDRAREAGATVLTSTPVKHITKEDITTQDGATYRFHHLVGADGSSSRVRKFLGLPSKQRGVGIHYEIEGEFERMIWHLDPALFGCGYGWIFPHKTGASIGAYAWKNNPDSRLLKQKLDHWIKKHGIDTGSARLRAGLINCDFRGYRFGNIFLVGDAAGLASGLTGEGIYPAIVSGETVASLLLGNEKETQPLERIIKKQQRHGRLIRLASTNRLFCRLMMETLILGLRTGIFNFTDLEMA